MPGPRAEVLAARLAQARQAAEQLAQARQAAERSGPVPQAAERPALPTARQVAERQVRQPGWVAA